MRFSKKTRFVLLSAVLLLVLQEVVLRICFPLPEVGHFYRGRFSYSTSGEVWPVDRYCTRTWQSAPDTNHVFEHRFNGYGFRDSEWSLEKPEGKTRVLLVGDSFMEGAMAPQDQTIKAGFEQAATKEYDLLNAGILGIGINDYLRLINEAVPLFKPDAILIVMYANDASFSPFVPPAAPPAAEYYHWWTPRLIELLSLMADDVALPWRWNRKPFIPPVPAPSNFWSRDEAKLRQHVTPEIAEYMKAGTYNFFRTNWVLVEERKLRERVDMSPHLAWLAEFSRQNNIPVGITYIPSRHQVTTYYYPFELASCQQECPPKLDLTGPQYQVHRQMIAANCNELGLPFLDLTERVKAEEARGNHLYWNYDDHMRGKGYMTVGKWLCESLEGE